MPSPRHCASAGPGLKPCNFEDALLKTYIGRVDGLEEFALEDGLERFDCRNNRLAWLGLQQDGFMVCGGGGEAAVWG